MIPRGSPRREREGAGGVFGDMKTITIIGFVALMGCHKDAPKTTLPPAQPATTAKTDTPAPTTAVSPNLGVSDDIAQKCNMHIANTQQAPKFGFDQFDLLPSDRDVLDAIAQCVTAGPLKGKRLDLVGRADPRGTEEYNLGLGSRRAHTVGDYLSRLGVGQTQLKETTRGALDATGTNDQGWDVDRRVDVRLD
ncbi:MAG TPA: OmpA family protein [Kofleriaceae bacterium]|jgi:peptidoglycan-associated lipoprotein|nr:OmpA family protein [Kofleriaceae bacterium]